jgi:hypothetical protein
MSTDGKVRPERVFRERWRARQSAGPRAGDLIKQPRWIDAGFVGLGVVLAAGAIAGATVTISRTTSLAAVVSGTSVTAVRAGGAAPTVGTAVQFRDESGATIPAVVTEVSATEVLAQLGRPEPASAGQLVVPAGRQRVISLLLPKLR